MKAIDLLSLSYYCSATWSIALLRLSLPGGDRALLEIERTNGFLYVCIGYVEICGAM